MRCQDSYTRVYVTRGMFPRKRRAFWNTNFHAIMFSGIGPKNSLYDLVSAIPSLTRPQARADKIDGSCD